MSIGEMIREKRKAAGLTQEQVANRLGVSAPAVNKWEKSNSYPDVTLLPALARLLGTDLNTLMCFEQTLTEKEISDICTKIAQRGQEEGFEAGYELAKGKIREYPTCARFIHMAAMTLQGMLLFSGFDEEKRNAYDKEITLMYERVIECGNDSQIKSNAAYMLASKYLNEKELEKAQKMLDILPSEVPDKRAMQARILEHQGKIEEAGLLLERWIQEDLTELQQALMMLMGLAVEEGDIERAEKLSDIGKHTAELYGMWGYNPLILPLELALRKEDKEKSLEYIEQMFSILSSVPEKKESSPLMAHLDAWAKRREEEKREQDGNGGKPTESPVSREQEYRRKVLSTLIEAMRSDGGEYAFLKNDERFTKLVQKYGGDRAAG